MSRRKQRFWSGFGIGAAAGAAAVLLPQLISRLGNNRIVRLEKNLQIGRPVEEVFSAWADWDRLPRASQHIADIRNYGNRSHWRVNVGGQVIEWDAITEQFITNQAIGWKSISGPKHTGRVTFSPIGDDTIVHVTMNYVPPSRYLRPLAASMSGRMEKLIEKVLREFKASVESRPRRGEAAPRTGTFDSTSTQN